MFWHGAYGDGELDWQALLPHLTGRFTCYLPSWRGRGLSDDHPDLSYPDVRIREIPATGHAAPLTHPQSLARALIEFCTITALCLRSRANRRAARRVLFARLPDWPLSHVEIEAVPGVRRAGRIREAVGEALLLADVLRRSEICSRPSMADD